MLTPRLLCSKRADAEAEADLAAKLEQVKSIQEIQAQLSKLIHLQHLKRKLKANQQFHDHYKAFMEDVINNGDAEPVPEAVVEEICWYIPHHGVYHPKKPGKLQ